MYMRGRMNIIHSFVPDIIKIYKSKESQICNLRCIQNNSIGTCKLSLNYNNLSPFTKRNFSIQWSRR